MAALVAPALGTLILAAAGHPRFGRRASATVLGVVGLALAFSCARGVTIDIPLPASQSMRLAPARLILVLAVLASYRATPDREVRANATHHVGAWGALVGLLIGLGLFVFSVVGRAAAESPWVVLGTVLRTSFELLLILVLAALAIPTFTTPRSRPATRAADVKGASGIWRRLGPASVLWIIVLAVPLSVTVDLERGAGAPFVMRTPLVDLVIWMAVAFEALRLLPARFRVALRPERVEDRTAAGRGSTFRLGLLPVIAAVSTLAGARSPTGWVDVLQIVDLYVLFAWLLARHLRAGADPPLVSMGVGFCYALLVAAASIQVLRGSPPYLTRGFFVDHQQFVAATLMLAPVAWCVMQSSPSRWIRHLGSVLIGAGAAVSGAAAVPVLVAAEIAGAGLLSGRRWWRQAGALVAIASATLFVLPAGYRHAVLTEPGTWFAVPMGERRAEVLAVKQSLIPAPPTLHFPMGNVHVFASSSLSNWPGRPSRVERVWSAGDRVFQEYFAESWAALRLLGQGGLLGTGAGSWQKIIGTGFGMLPRTGTTFPDSQNGYLLLGVTLGPLGLLGWLLLLGAALRRARRAAVADGGTSRGWASAGALAGLIGSIAALWICPIATMPLGVYWVLLAGMVPDES